MLPSYHLIWNKQRFLSKNGSLVRLSLALNLEDSSDAACPLLCDLLFFSRCNRWARWIETPASTNNDADGVTTYGKEFSRNWKTTYNLDLIQHANSCTMLHISNWCRRAQSHRATKNICIKCWKTICNASQICTTDVDFKTRGCFTTHPALNYESNPIPRQYHWTLKSWWEFRRLRWCGFLG